MQVEFSKISTTSHASLALINYRQERDNNLTSFIYTECEFLLPSCGTTTEQYRGKLKIDLFSSQLFNEKIARRIIRKHLITVTCAF